MKKLMFNRIFFLGSFFVNLATPIALSLALAATAQAEETIVSVEAAEAGASGGADAGLLSAVVELAKSAVANEPGYRITSSGPSTLKLRARILKLGSAYVVSMDRISGGEVNFSAKMKAASAEDLDVVTPRVVKAALSGSRSEETAEVDTITHDETVRATRRFQATRQWKFGFGPVWGSGLGTDKSGLVYELGYVWGLDPQWDVDITWRVASLARDGQTGAYFSDLSIGGTYYLTKSRTAPYLTGGIGRAGAQASRADSILISDDTASGWAGRLGVGARFFRTSTVNLGLELNHTRLFAETSRTQSTPAITSLSIGVYF